jgi:hypothetical protein
MEHLEVAVPADSDPSPGRAERVLTFVAEGCFGATFLATPGLLFIAILFVGPLNMAVRHSAVTVLGIVALVAFFISGFTLGRLWRLGRRARLRSDQGLHQSRAERRRLWQRSLICNLLVVACLIYICGLKIGLILCTVEMVSVVIHLAALRLPSLRA